MFQRLWRRMAALVAAVICFGVAPGCRPARPGEAREVVPELKLEEVRFRVWRGAELRAYGEAHEASLRRDSSEVHARDLVAFLPHDPEPVRIAAPEGDGNLASQRFAVRGGVTVTRGEDVARTPSAAWAPDPGKTGGIVRGDQAVVVTGRGYRLEGTGFTLDPASGDLSVRGATRLDAGLPEAR
jgi:lipopolysaccharide export system protein LptC